MKRSSELIRIVFFGCTAPNLTAQSLNEEKSDNFKKDQKRTYTHHTISNAKETVYSFFCLPYLKYISELALIFMVLELGSLSLTKTRRIHEEEKGMQHHHHYCRNLIMMTVVYVVGPFALDQINFFKETSSNVTRSTLCFLHFLWQSLFPVEYNPSTYIYTICLKKSVQRSNDIITFLKSLLLLNYFLIQSVDWYG